MYSAKARAVVSRQNVKHRLCITKEKLDCYSESYTGKSTSVVHEATPLIQWLLTTSNSEAILSHSEWAYVWRWVMENFVYNESASYYLIITSTLDVTKKRDVNSLYQELRLLHRSHTTKQLWRFLGLHYTWLPLYFLQINDLHLLGTQTGVNIDSQQTYGPHL